MQDLFRHLRIHTATKEKNMIWVWLSISKFFNKIGNYFYMKHCESLRAKRK
jgi:hypothetical protein